MVLTKTIKKDKNNLGQKFVDINQMERLKRLES